MRWRALEMYTYTLNVFAHFKLKCLIVHLHTILRACIKQNDVHGLYRLFYKLNFTYNETMDYKNSTIFLKPVI